MHRLPFISGHKKRVDSKSSRPGKSTAVKHSPKLERSIALRNVDYEPSTSSSSSYSGSLDLDRMRSFRIDGTGGGIEGMFRDLGLSADDFVIPAAEWEAMKVRSSSDPLPFLSDSTGLIVCEDSEVCMVNPLRSDCDVGGFGTSQDAGVCGTVDRLDDRLRCDSVVLDETESVRLVPGNDGRRGIKGLKPPTLTTPSPMSLPLVDDSCSTWDIVNAFVPNEDRESDFKLPGSLRPGGEVGYIDGAQEWAGEDGDVKNDIGTRLTNEVLSPSSSFTTNSNDDDSSSTTTEPMSVISPSGKFLRIITGWQKGGLLGSGSFGTVYEGIADGGFFFAVKEVSLLDQCEEGKQRICNLEHEIALLRQFEHENIVQYYGTEKDDSKLYIFLELVSKGSLLELYQKYWLRDSQVSRYTRQILLGLKYLHDQNVIHRDIKCANILVDTNGSVKLADFGLAKSIKLNDVKSCKGTAFWMAPEVVNNRRSSGYGLAADIWSLGCTVLEMLTRQFPYSNLENHMQAIFRIGKGEPPHVPNTLSDDALDFIHSCLQVDPIARPSASQLLEHPFVKQPLTPSTSVSASASPRCVGKIGAF